MGAWLATVAGEWEGCKCGLLRGQSCPGCPLFGGAGWLWRKGELFLVGSEQDAEL